MSNKDFISKLYTMSDIHVRSNSILRLCCYSNIYEVDKVVKSAPLKSINLTGQREERKSFIEYRD